jgi:hypothetical protein
VLGGGVRHLCSAGNHLGTAVSASISGVPFRIVTGRVFAMSKLGSESHLKILLSTRSEHKQHD